MKPKTARTLFAVSALSAGMLLSTTALADEAVEEADDDTAVEDAAVTDAENEDTALDAEPEALIDTATTDDGPYYSDNWMASWNDGGAVCSRVAGNTKGPSYSSQSACEADLYANDTRRNRRNR